MYIVTGTAGFIGSCVAARMLQAGMGPIVSVDKFDVEAKRPNWEGLPVEARVDRDDFFAWVAGKEHLVKGIVHMGALTDTTLPDYDVFQVLNVDYTQRMWHLAARHGIPLVYASSAATYGAGEHGFGDAHGIIPDLQPLNPYGVSKNEVDKWALQEPTAPPFWAGLKFFNVYGPNEYHKGRMASVVFHAFNQIKATGELKLFRSHRPDFRDGEQLRDFVYVKDVANVILWLLRERPASAIYNLGTGQARTFLDLGRAVFRAMDVAENIRFIDTPADIRDSYQYFTEAQMGKLRVAGYRDGFASLEAGIMDYVQQYLMAGAYLR